MHDDAPPARLLGTSSQVGVSGRRRSSAPANEVRAREPESRRSDPRPVGRLGWFATMGGSLCTCVSLTRCSVSCACFGASGPDGMTHFHMCAL